MVWSDGRGAVGGFAGGGLEGCGVEEPDCAGWGRGGGFVEGVP